VIDLYHEVRDSLDTGVMDIHTIAIGDFENNSVYQGKFKKYDYELFRPALVHAIITDLSASTELRIVDRQRTEKIVEETQLGAAGIVDPGSAVRAGKLLGAHCFVFGQYMILSKKTVRIDLRVVHTATGEIIVAKQVTGEFSGKPEKFLEIEQELVMEVAAAVDSVVMETTGKASFLKTQAEEYFVAQAEDVKEKKDYPETQFLVGDAWQKEQAEDYASALETWKKVLDIDPDNRDAKRRVLILTSHVTG